MADRRSSYNRTALRLGLWARRVDLTRRLAIALAAAALLSGIATYAAMTGWAPTDPNSNVILFLLNLDLVLLLVLGAVVARRLVALWVARRHGGAGSRLHLRFVGLFSALAVTPAILVAIFSALFFNVGVQSWFDERVKTALNESQAVAEAYLKEHQQVIAGQVLAVGNDLQRNYPQVMRDQDTLERFLATQANVRGLTEAVIFDRTGKVLARAGYTFSLQFEEVPFWAIEKAQNGEVAVLTGESDDRVRALVKIEIIPEIYLFVGRFVDVTVLQHVKRTDEAVQAYLRLEQGRSGLEITFSLIFIVVALLLLFAAVWIGLVLATRLARPVVELIDASERVSAGELDVQVQEIAASDELAVLSRAFNRMTRRIASQQTRLLETNRELDERRRFTETVLAGVSAGVMSIDPGGHISLVNRSASALLQVVPEDCAGKPLGEVVPEFTDLVEIASKRADGQTQSEVQILRDGKPLMFLVRVAVENLDGETIGHILTFDDITALQTAQRTAAWADVARRIAHEIKNPLTPIQLSAERLKRKYLKQIAVDPEIFVQCTDTIVRHVSDIGQMVDEFSSFARMPAPVMKPEDVGKMVSQAVFLQRTAYPGIIFDSDMPENPLLATCDSRQIGQAVTNLLKNAVEAIEGRPRPEAGAALPRGHIRVSVQPAMLAEHGAAVSVAISDNGRGLPDDRARLTEPYVTTRSKGTGLGLAIVKKILEDHRGELTLQDAEGGGACISLILPLTSIIEADMPTVSGADHGA